MIEPIKVSDDLVIEIYDTSSIGVYLEIRSYQSGEYTPVFDDELDSLIAALQQAKQIIDQQAAK